MPGSAFAPVPAGPIASGRPKSEREILPIFRRRGSEEIGPCYARSSGTVLIVYTIPSFPDYVSRNFEIESISNSIGASLLALTVDWLIHKVNVTRLHG